MSDEQSYAATAPGSEDIHTETAGEGVGGPLSEVDMVPEQANVLAGAAAVRTLAVVVLLLLSFMFAYTYASARSASSAAAQGSGVAPSGDIQLAGSVCGSARGGACGGSGGGSGSGGGACGGSGAATPVPPNESSAGTD